MAQYLISILGELLLKAPLDLPNPGQLPSPNDLKRKVLIKNKKEAASREAAELSDLVIYTNKLSVKFTSFRHARQHQTPHQNTSMEDLYGRPLCTRAGQSLRSGLHPPQPEVSQQDLPSILQDLLK